MPAKLYPPQITGTLPAFWLTYDSSNLLLRGADIKIPFSMNQVVSATSVKGFMLRLRTASSGSYIFSPIFSNDYNMSENIVIFHLTASQAGKLNEGQFYKVQIAYCSSTIENALGVEENDQVGYFSTVGVIKCTSKPSVYINNLSQENINLFANQFVGIYDQSECRDQTEKVYSYEFIVYDHLDNVYYTTGEQLHKSYYDTKMDVSLDTVLLNDFMNDSTGYSIQYKVTTINGLQLSSPKYSLTADGVASSNKPITILPEMDDETGSTIVKFQGAINNDRSFYYVLNEKVFTQIEVDDPPVLASDPTLISELTDSYQYEYEKDKANKTPIDRIRQGLSNTQNKVTYLETKTLYRRWKKDMYGNTYFYYTIIDSAPEKMTLVAGRYYFYDNDLIKVLNKETLSKDYKRMLSKLDEWPEELKMSWEFNSDNLTYFEIISSCENLVQRFSYQEVLDNPLIDIQRYKDENLLLAENKFESLYYGSYILLRASSDDNYSTWYIINRFRLDDQRPSSYYIKDVTIEHGKKYKYALTQYNLWGLQSAKVISDVYQAGFEDAFLYDGEKTLKIRYNPEVSSFKITVLEQKSDTLGGRFPFISRNGDTFYREFPIAGLLAQELDIDNSFCNKTVPLAHRHSTRSLQNIYDKSGELIEETDMPENGDRDWHMFSDENIALEREFKMNVLEWLNNGKPKLFKSPYEGNFIVRLLNNSLTPVKELGRMLHSFQSQAYEIAECTYENLVAYGFIKTGFPSDYVGLFKTYKLTDPSLFDSDGNVDIVEADNGGIVSFVIQDMWPGDIAYITFFDGTTEEIMIGITGSYTYVGDKKVSRIFIPQYQYEKIHRNIIGTINCYYYGARITAFDAIQNMALKTVPSQQFIGINPYFYNLRSTDIDSNDQEYTITSNDFSALSEYNIRDYLTKLGTLDENATSLTIKNTKDANNLKIYKKLINSYEPGDLIGRINATLNSGEISKLELIKLEQGKFRLRELIPVYEVNDNYNTVHFDIYPARPGSAMPPDTYYYKDEVTGNYILEHNNRADPKRTYYEKKSRNVTHPGTNIQAVLNGEKLIKENSNELNTMYVSVSPFGYPYPIEELTETVLLDPFCIFQVFRRVQGEWVPVTKEVKWRDNESVYTSYYDPYYKTWIPYYDPYVQINYNWKKIVYAPYGFDIDLFSQDIQIKEQLIKNNKEILQSLKREFPNINIEEEDNENLTEEQEEANRLIAENIEIEEQLSAFGSTPEERAAYINFCARRRQELSYINKGKSLSETHSVEQYEIKNNQGFYFVQSEWTGTIDEGTVQYTPIFLEQEGLQYKPYLYYYRLENGEYTKDSSEVGPQVYYTSKELLKTYPDVLIKCVAGTNPNNENAIHYYLSPNDIIRYTADPNQRGQKYTFSYKDPSDNEVTKQFQIMGSTYQAFRDGGTPFYMPIIINVDNINKTYYLTQEQFYELVDNNVNSDYTVIKENSEDEVNYLQSQAKSDDTDEIKTARQTAIKKAKDTTFNINNYKYTTSLDGYEITCHDEYYNCYIYNNQKYYLTNEQQEQLFNNEEIEGMENLLRLIPSRQYYIKDAKEYNYNYSNRIDLSVYDCFESSGNTYLLTDDIEIKPYKIYYFKEYGNLVDLSAVREKDYTQLSDVNSIRIGSAVMAELTFQLKVLDFYTEIRQSKVAAAKQEYLDAKDFFLNLLKSYSILEESDVLARKNNALQELYYKLIYGTEITGKLSKTSQDYLKNILQSDTEVEKFNFLKLYEIISVNKNIGSEVVAQVIKTTQESKEKYSDTFSYENLKLFTFTDDTNVLYYVIDTNSPIVFKENTDNSLSWYYQIKNSDETGIYFAIDKNNYFINTDDEDVYLPFLTNDNDNIKISLTDKEVITNNGYTVYPLEEQSNIILISTHLELLNKDEYKKAKQQEDVLEIHEIKYENGKVIYVDSEKEIQEENITKTFFEEEEVNALVEGEGADVKGTQYKQEVSNDLLDIFKNDLEKAKENLNDIKEQYITYYTNIQKAEEEYNTAVYQRWAMDEAIRLDTKKKNLTLKEIVKYLNNNLVLIKKESANIINNYKEIEKYYNAIIGNINNIRNLLKERLDNIVYRREMINDNFNDVALDEQLRLSIISDFGYAVFYLYLIYYLVNKIKENYNQMLAAKNVEPVRYTETQYNNVKKYIKEIHRIYNLYRDQVLKQENIAEVREGIKYILRLWKNNFIVNDNMLKTMLTNFNAEANDPNEIQAIIEELKVISPLYDDILFMSYNRSSNINIQLDGLLGEENTIAFSNFQSLNMTFDISFITNDTVFDDNIVNLSIADDNNLTELQKILKQHILTAIKKDEVLATNFEEKVINRMYYHRLFLQLDENSLDDKTIEKKLEELKTLMTTFIFYPLSEISLDPQITEQYNNVSPAYTTNNDFYDRKLNLFQKEEVVNMNIQLCNYLITYLQQFIDDGLGGYTFAARAIQEANSYKQYHYFNIMSGNNEESKLVALKTAIADFNDFISQLMNEYGSILFEIDNEFVDLITSMQFPQIISSMVKSREYFLIPEKLFEREEGKDLVLTTNEDGDLDIVENIKISLFRNIFKTTNITSEINKIKEYWQEFINIVQKHPRSTESIDGDYYLTTSNMEDLKDESNDEYNIKITATIIDENYESVNQTKYTKLSLVNSYAQEQNDNSSLTKWTVADSGLVRELQVEGQYYLTETQIEQLSDTQAGLYDIPIQVLAQRKYTYFDLIKEYSKKASTDPENTLTPCTINLNNIEIKEIENKKGIMIKYIVTEEAKDIRNKYQELLNMLLDKQIVSEQTIVPLFWPKAPKLTQLSNEDLTAEWNNRQLHTSQVYTWVWSDENNKLTEITNRIIGYQTALREIMQTQLTSKRYEYFVGDDYEWHTILDEEDFKETEFFTDNEKDQLIQLEVLQKKIDTLNENKTEQLNNINNWDVDIPVKLGEDTITYETPDKARNAIEEYYETKINNIKEQMNEIHIFDDSQEAINFVFNKTIELINTKFPLLFEMPKVQEYISLLTEEKADIAANLDITTVEDSTLSEDGAFVEEFIKRYNDYYIKTKEQLIEQAEQLLLLYEKQANNYREKYETYKDLYEENLALFNNFKNKYPEIWEYYESQKENENTDSLISLSEVITDQQKKVKDAWKKFLNLLDQYYTAEKKAGLYI